jgi:XTP/dITP diphosphohydrolase
VRELRTLLHEFKIEMVDMTEMGVPSPVELTFCEGGTIGGNARMKAEHCCGETGLWALADDSGICVDALGGGPGVDSAHFGGAEKIIEALAGVPPEERGAANMCVLALARPGMETLTFEGVCRGSAAEVAAGKNGFGFDPGFIPEGSALTFAQMSPEMKANFSARGRAGALLVSWWKNHA